MALIGFSLPFNVPISKERIHGVPTNPPTRITLPRSAVTCETLAPFPRKSQSIRSSSSSDHQTKEEEEEESSEISIQDEEVRDPGVKAALSMLKFYKREISPLLPSSCRYVPTCSEYSMEAYKKYGVAKGTILTAWRLCRCNPLGGYGFDPPRWFDEGKPSDH